MQNQTINKSTSTDKAVTTIDLRMHTIILTIGPSGCGKTFFAEKMAEEIGFNFYQIKPSDIQSKWVNASQENIKNLFEEAKKLVAKTAHQENLQEQFLITSNDLKNLICHHKTVEETLSGWRYQLFGDNLKRLIS